MKNEQLTRSLKMINFTLGSLWSIGLGIGMALSYTICEKIHCHINELSNDDVSKLLGTFAILISAGIASASVMKNIAETKANEVKKHEKEDSKFYLEKCIAYLKEVDLLIGNRQSNPFHWKLAADILVTIKKIYPKITEESHISIFHIEYNTSSFKLLQSLINNADGIQDYVKTPFFCSLADQTVEMTDEYFKTIKEKQSIINPASIIPIFQFMQFRDNQFLTKDTDYAQWRKLNINTLKNDIPWILVYDYLELYKRNIPE